MAPQPIEKTVNLTVSNFGPIIEAEIDLRPITVFAGPSNTGKSYMATVIYAIQRFFSGGYGFGPMRFNPRSFMPNLMPSDDSPISEDVLNDIAVWLDHASSNSEPKALPKSVESLLLHGLGISKYYQGVFMDEMLRCFGKGDLERLPRHGSGSEAKVAITIPTGEDAAMSLDYAVTMSEDGDSVFQSCVPETLPLETANRAALALQNYRPRIRERGALTAHMHREYMALGFCAGTIHSEFISHLAKNIHYLPADRTGMMHAHRMVVSSLVSRASRSAQFRDEPLPALSGVLADFLESLIRLGERERSPKTDSAPWKAADRIEKTMLAGAVQTTKSAAGYPQFHYRPRGWKEALPLMSSASMVSELAPVVLYLRHVVAPGDTLIIEEPESHLHPAMQVEFMRQLAAVALAGVRVIITTHSEWVLDELGNLARLSLLPEAGRQGIPGADYALKPEDVGVWLFRPQIRQAGSVVEEIPFGEEFGGYSADFNDIALETYNSHAEISNRIEEARNP